MPGSPKQVQFTRRFLEEKRKGKFGGKKKTYKCLLLRPLGPFFVFLFFVLYPSLKVFSGIRGEGGGIKCIGNGKKGA